MEFSRASRRISKRSGSWFTPNVVKPRVLGSSASLVGIDWPPSFGVPTAMCRFPSMQVLSGVRGETGGLRGVILQTKAGTEHEG